MSACGAASVTWPSSSTSSAASSSAGASHARCMLTWPWMRSRWPSGGAAAMILPDWCTTATEASSTPPSATPTDWKRSERRGQLARVETPTTNALAEVVNGLYKAEIIHRQGPWRSLEHVELATAGWVDWWNYRRLHSTIGNLPPAEYEALYYRQHEAAEAA